MFSKRKPLLSVLILLLFLLATLYISYSFILPRYIESKILPEFGRQLSSSLSGRIFKLGLYGADLGDIVLGDPQRPAVSIGLIHADYSPPLLLKKKPGPIKINGIRLNLDISGGKIRLPGLDFEKYETPQRASNSSATSESISLPVMPDSIQIQHGLITLIHETGNYLVPFELKVNRQGQEDVPGLPVYRFIMQVEYQGQHIAVEGVIDPANNKAVMSVKAPDLDLNRIIPAGILQPDMITMGKGSITADASFSLKPFQLKEARATGDLEPIVFSQMPIRFGGVVEEVAQNRAIVFDFRNEGKSWRMKTRAAISEPVGASLEVDSSAVWEEENVHSTGTFVFKVPDQPELQQQTHFKPVIKHLPEILGNFTLVLGNNGTWQTTIKGHGTELPGRQAEVLHIQYLDNILKTGIPVFSLQGRGEPDNNEMDVVVTIPVVEGKYSNAEIQIPQVSLRASFKQERKQNRQNSGSGEFSITLNDSQLNRNGLSGRADLELQGNVEQPAYEKNRRHAFGRLTVKRAELTDTDNKIIIKSIEGKVPWRWPVSSKESVGEIKAGNIVFDSNDLGSFKADVRLKKRTYFLEGLYTSSLLQGIIAKVAGQAEITDSGLQGDLSALVDTTPLASVHLGKFHASLANSYFSGVLGLESSMHFDTAGVQGKMHISVEQGRFEMEEKKYDVQDIEISLLLPSLPDLRSTPAQKITFRKASAGNLVFEDGRIIWQLESSESVFIEEAMLHWVEGRIFTNAIRLSREKKDISATIFCDRLNLAKLLEQFGVKNAQGEGTVSGRIPLIAGRNTVKFEDGFLYSSPGQGGSVRVAAFDTLAAGIPQNTPQFAQVDFAAEALKNFRYEWVKLLFNTEGEELIMQMQMDGKPVQSLPFRYDSKTGKLQRIENGGQGINQAIRLDVNFRLPLNRFLGYSGRIQDIMNKIK